LASGGTITGTPTSTGTYDFTVQVTDSSTLTPETATANLSIGVSAAPAESPTAVDGSSNWSGYVVGDGPYTSVTGTFTVTSLASGATTSEYLAEWVGIDGFSNTSLIQAGINEQVDPYNTSEFIIQPWWEILPASETDITTMTVAPGDQVTVTIAELSAGEWSITLKDDTSGASFTTDQTYDGPATSAEWIVEAPTVNNTQTVLAPYSPDVAFTSLGVGGTESSLDEIIMVQSNTTVSDPSAMTSVGFNVAYGATPAPTP
ncbi:MAG: G1 family glutamic endopeptidase, partial [Acidimicrobiales bacterium]